MAKKKKNKTVFGVIGVLLVLFGIIGTIPILLNHEYYLFLFVTAISVIIGVVLMAWTLSD